MVKSHEKKKFTLFSYDGAVKRRRNLNFEKMDTASYTGRSTSNITIIITAVLRKANAHSAAICISIKKSIM